MKINKICKFAVLSLASFMIVATGGQLLNNNQNVNQVTATSDDAAWRVEAYAWWGTAPTSNPVKDSYINFVNDANETVAQQEIKTQVSDNKVTIKYNSLKLPQSFNIYLKNNGFATRTIYYRIYIYYLGKNVYTSKEYSRYFYTKWDDDLN